MHLIQINNINQYKHLLSFNKIYLKISFNLNDFTKSKCEWKEQTEDILGALLQRVSITPNPFWGWKF